DAAGARSGGAVLQEETVGRDVEDAWSAQVEESLLRGVGAQVESGLREQALNGQGLLAPARKRRPAPIREGPAVAGEEALDRVGAFDLDPRHASVRAGCWGGGGG